MRNIADNYGFAANEEFGLLIKIESGIAVYISDKRIDLYDGESRLNVICDILPAEINNQEIKFISEIKSVINFTKGELFQDENIFVVKIINKDSAKQIFNDSLIDAEISILFFAFNNNGIVEINDLFLYQKAKIKNIVLDNEYLITIKCSIGNLFQNDIIPQERITKSEYPCLLASSDGKAAPLLYGYFSATDAAKEEYDLAPAVKVDDFENIYLASSSPLSNIGNCYFYDSQIGRYTKILSDIEITNSNPVKIRHDYMVLCEAKFRIKQRGSRTSAEIAGRYVEYLNGVGSSLPLNSEEALYLALPEAKKIDNIEYYYEGNEYGNLQLSVLTGSAQNGPSGIAAKIVYYLNDELHYIPGNDITELNCNGWKSILINLPEDEFLRSLKIIEFGIIVELGGMVEFKNMTAQIKYIR